MKEIEEIKGKARNILNQGLLFTHSVHLIEKHLLYIVLWHMSGTMA